MKTDDLGWGSNQILLMECGVRSKKWEKEGSQKIRKKEYSKSLFWKRQKFQNDQLSHF